jgi:hypothetical protein
MRIVSRRYLQVFEVFFTFSPYTREKEKNLRNTSNTCKYLQDVF